MKYANEMTEEVIHLTQYHIKYINSVLLAKLQRTPLKLGRLYSSTGSTLLTRKILFTWQLILFQPHKLDFNILVITQAE